MFLTTKTSLQPIGPYFILLDNVGKQPLRGKMILATLKKIAYKNTIEESLLNFFVAKPRLKC